MEMANGIAFRKIDLLIELSVMGWSIIFFVYDAQEEWSNAIGRLLSFIHTIGEQ